MVHAAKKKLPKGDSAFTTKKQKVGKKKLAPVTATRAQVHAAGLRIVRPEQESLAEGKALVDVVSSERRKPIRALSECIAETTHYRDVARAGAFGGIARYLSLTLPKQKAANAQKQQHRGGINRQQSTPADVAAPGGGGATEGGEAEQLPEQLDTDGNSLEAPSPLQMLSLLQLCVDRQTDGHQEARKYSLSILKMLFEEQLPLDLVSLISFVQLPLTHAEHSIKSTGLELLDLLLIHYPAFATVQSIVQHQQAASNSAAAGGVGSGGADAPGNAFEGEDNLLESLTSAAAHAVLSMPTGSPAQRAGYTTLLHLLQRLYPLPLIGFDDTGAFIAPRYPGASGAATTTQSAGHGAQHLRQNFFQKIVGKTFYARLCTLWGELSDIKAGGKHVLRDADQANFGCTVLQLLEIIGQELVNQQCMTKAYVYSLKSILSRFPFSVEELTKRHGGKEHATAQRWKLALAMAGALNPIYGTSPDTTNYVDTILRAAGERAGLGQQQQAQAHAEEEDYDDEEAEEEEDEEDDENEEDEDIGGAHSTTGTSNSKNTSSMQQGRPSAASTFLPLPVSVEIQVLELVHHLVVRYPLYASHVLRLITGPLSRRTEHWVVDLGSQNQQPLQLPGGGEPGATPQQRVLQLWVSTVRASLSQVLTASAGGDPASQRIAVPTTQAGGEEDEHDAVPKLFQGLNEIGTTTKVQKPEQVIETLGDLQEGIASALGALPKSLFLLTRLVQEGDGSTDDAVVQTIANDFARLLWQAFARRSGHLTSEAAMSTIPAMLTKLISPLPRDQDEEEADASPSSAAAAPPCMLSPLGDSTVEIVAAAAQYANWGSASSSSTANNNQTVVSKGHSQVFGVAFLE